MIHTIFTIIIIADLIFLLVHIIGNGAAGIVEWLCWPFFGLAGVPLVIAIVIRIAEGIEIGIWIRSIF